MSTKNWFAKQIVAWRNKQPKAPRKTNFEKVYRMRPGLYEYHSPALNLADKIQNGTFHNEEKSRHGYGAEFFEGSPWQGEDPAMVQDLMFREIEIKTTYTKIADRFVPKADAAFYAEPLPTLEIEVDSDETMQ